MNQPPEYLLGPHKATIIAAARELLHATPAGGAIFEIPGLQPRHVVVLGAASEIGQLLDAPAREPMIGGRRKEDVRPAEPLDWNEPEPGQPRRWTILVTSAGHGLVGEPGAKFEHADAKHERVDVLEAGPVLARIAELEEQLAAHAARMAVLEGGKLVPAERSYDQRAKMIIAFNTASGDLDDKLDAAHRAMLAAAPRPDVKEEGKED